MAKLSSGQTSGTNSSGNDVWNTGDMAIADDMYEAARDADALVICTEWSEFRTPDFHRLHGIMRKPTIFDGRNLWEPHDMASRGFTYHCVGRPAVIAQEHTAESTH